MDVTRSSKRGRRMSVPIIVLLLGVIALPLPVAAVESPLEDTNAGTDSLPLVTLAGGESSLEDTNAGADALADTLDPAYLVGDWELRDVGLRHLRFGSGPVPPTLPEGRHDADGLPVQPLGPGAAPVYNPTVLAQQGLRYLHGYRKTSKWIYRRRANEIADKLDEIARIRGVRWQPHKYDRSDQTKGWVNANSHGLVLSFFSRYYRLTGKDAMLDTAASLLPAFDNDPQDARWLTLTTKNGYLWFEHWPDGRKTHVLNGHINALLGLYEFWRESESVEAEMLIQAGLKTVRDKLDRFRRKNNLSRYGLNSKWGSVHYHHVHIDQLRTLAKITGDGWFDRRADQFERDEAAWRKRVGRR